VNGLFTRDNETDWACLALTLRRPESHLRILLRLRASYLCLDTRFDHKRKPIVTVAHLIAAALVICGRLFTLMRRPVGV
jgi:hypothetical protein